MILLSPVPQQSEAVFEHSAWDLPTLVEHLTHQVAAWTSQGGQATLLRTFNQRDVRLRTSPTTFADFCLQLGQALPLSLITMVALDERAATGMYLVRSIFHLSSSPLFLSVEAAIPDGPPNTLAYQSLTPHMPAANWYEREIRDLFGLIPLGHPDPRRLVVHRHWPTEIYPLRQDVSQTNQPPFVPDEEDFHNRVGGDGLQEIPVGPIHAGIIEPGHFRFSTVGEQILNLEARLFYTHRGIEKQCEGRPFAHALLLAERNCAACTVSSTLALCQALEQIAQVEQEIPARARFLRLIYAELERLYNHIGDLGNICAGIGFHAGAQDGAWLKERLLSLNEQLLGSRYLFGVLIPGGVRRDLGAHALDTLGTRLPELQRAFEALFRLITTNEGVMERFQGTGVLTRQTAHDLEAVGVAARASGIDRDVRRDVPYAAYREVPPTKIPVLSSGDVTARVLIRAEEVRVSFQLLTTALACLPDGPLSVSLGTVPAQMSSFSLTESPRGENCHWVQTGPDNTIARYRIRSASYANWPLVVRAALTNMLPDFPLINKSFELCYSCLDR